MVEPKRAGVMALSGLHRCLGLAICAALLAPVHAAGAPGARLTPLDKACVAAIASGDKNLARRLDRGLMDAVDKPLQQTGRTDVTVTTFEQGKRRFSWTLTCQFGSNLFSPVPYLREAADWPDFCDCAAVVFDQRMLAEARAAVRKFWSSTGAK
jgi:hypothetical protein